MIRTRGETPDARSSASVPVRDSVSLWEKIALRYRYRFTLRETLFRLIGQI